MNSEPLSERRDFGGPKMEMKVHKFFAISVPVLVASGKTTGYLDKWSINTSRPLNPRAEVGKPHCVSTDTKSHTPVEAMD
jgi:hypothetical protein